MPINKKKELKRILHHIPGLDKKEERKVLHTFEKDLRGGLSRREIKRETWGMMKRRKDTIERSEASRIRRELLDKSS
ncbi:MAG: hypothetical protein HY460_01560 [Parcubacteria group bacterium]|nr:hypothetical protein [Parcubacteria group bacterium]